MPSSSSKQHRFMEAVAHNPAFAKKVGISQSVGKEFSAADKGRKFEKGGATMMSKKVPEAMRRRPRMGAGMPPPAPPVMPPQPPAPMGMKKGGMAGMHKMPDGKMMKNSAMKKGSMPMKDGKPAFMMGKKMNMGGMAKYASGGSVSARADGIASKGKTKGKMC